MRRHKILKQRHLFPDRLQFALAICGEANKGRRWKTNSSPTEKHKQYKWPDYKHKSNGFQKKCAAGRGSFLARYNERDARADGGDTQAGGMI